MPIYEYFCPQCKLKFELLRPISQVNEAAPCPQCHNDAERSFSTFAAVSKSADGLLSPVGGFSPCSTCSATTCTTCHQ
jgi:putative FmdB family regulatory protein